MKNKILFILSISFIIFTQERSVIFNAPPNNLDEGFDIYYDGYNQNSIAEKFYLSNDYVLEGISLWLNPLTASTISIQILSDTLNLPSSLIYEWPLTMVATNIYQEYSISTVSDCINLTGGEYYWLSVKAVSEFSSVKWQYSLFNNYYSTSDDNGENWSMPIIGSLGATSVRGEQIFTYSPGIPNGDVNYDYSTDVLDIVLTVSFVLDTEELSDDQQSIIDLNHDLSVDVLDIVLLVELILQEPDIMPDFVLQDINPNSEYFGEYIGPSFFLGQVTGYYFGKAG